jgi:hypothetical protein
VPRSSMSWSRRLFADAVDAKRRDLRVRRDNPVLGAKPPEGGEWKAKVYVYPAEAEQLSPQRTSRTAGAGSSR